MEPAYGLIISVLAVFVYIDARRKGLGGFRRLAAFWFGFPATFFVMMLVRDGSQPAIRSHDEGITDLVAEIRKDRAARLHDGAGATDLDEEEANARMDGGNGDRGDADDERDAGGESGG